MNISVIIPCYNCEKFIEETVDSILKQSVLPLEIILINDNSSDNTLSILNNIEKKSEIIKIFDLKINKGPSFSRNYGASKSKEDYILFFDSDDLALPYLIEKSIKRFHELNDEFDDKYILSYCSYVQIDENSKVISGITKGIQTDPEEILGYEFLRNYISTSGVLIKKQFFYKANKFNESLEYAEDWDLWLRLAKEGGFCYIDEPLVMVRRSNNSVSFNLKNMQLGERLVLKQYSIDYIENAINRRKLPKYINTCDFVSMMFRLENYEEGFKRLKILSPNYEYYNIYFLLGLYYIKKSKLDLALDNFFKTIKLKENHGAALNNIGAIYLLKNNRTASLDFLNKALEYFPGFMDAKYNLNLLHNEEENINFKNVRFTLRELRDTLLKYNEG
ncbi:glycosyltransferase family A protein [Clostridium hydrogenum]|uniref:glycosyltransferase family A protein n=1 Tax=Clostridium hydrogenum TaxID=2855764 RepID=UPI001F46AB63|nr:glycosyltransferase family A protein [Clostridium hydrogenum]